MTLFYLALAVGIAVLINLRNRWARLGGQLLAAVALFFNIWSIWLAVEDGTFAAAATAGASLQAVSLQVMGVAGSAALLGLLLLLPAQWRDAGAVVAGNRVAGWGQASRLLHWSSAVLMLCALPMGLFVTVLPQGAIRAEFRDGHVGVGLAVLALLVARLAWQAASPGPASPGTAARLNKWLLYALLLALPLTGLALSGDVLGLPLPALLSGNAARISHQILSALFVAAFAAHAGAVIWHQYGRREPLIRRMLR
jgi:cytochrome b561